jgi:hypothetical protein
LPNPERLAGFEPSTFCMANDRSGATVIHPQRTFELTLVFVEGRDVSFDQALGLVGAVHA